MLNNYYNVLSVRREDDWAVYTVSLNPDCEVYMGHFPGNPVSPGVCSIQMVLECAERECAVSGFGRKLAVGEIRQCRFTALVSPQTCPLLEVRVSMAWSDVPGAALGTSSGQESGFAPGSFPEHGGRTAWLKASIVHDGTVCLSIKASVYILQNPCREETVTVGCDR